MKIQGLKAIAEFFSVSARTVRNWRNSGAPISRKYEAESDEITLWQVKYKKGRGGGRQGTLSTQSGQDFEKERLTRLQANKLQLELDERKGELISRTEMKLQNQANIVMMQNRLRYWVHKLPPLLARQDERPIFTVLMAEVRQFLMAYARCQFTSDQIKQFEAILRCFDIYDFEVLAAACEHILAQKEANNE
jgi:phage terminase Nu1 subunit (DNA packaging protein)